MGIDNSKISCETERMNVLPEWHSNILFKIYEAQAGRFHISELSLLGVPEPANGLRRILNALYHKGYIGMNHITDETSVLVPADDDIYYTTRAGLEYYYFYRYGVKIETLTALSETQFSELLCKKEVKDDGIVIEFFSGIKTQYEYFYRTSEMVRDEIERNEELERHEIIVKGDETDKVYVIIPLQSSRSTLRVKLDLALETAKKLRNENVAKHREQIIIIVENATQDFNDIAVTCQDLPKLLKDNKTKEALEFFETLKEKFQISLAFIEGAFAEMSH